MSSNVTLEEQIEKINHFTQQLVNSGYGYRQCREIVISMLKGKKKKEESMKGQLKRYKSAQDTLAERNLNKLMENTNWYKSKGTADHEKAPSFNFERWGEEQKEKWKETAQSWKGWRKQKGKKKKKKPVGVKSTEKKEGVKLQSVIFLQHTPNSELARNIKGKLRELEKVGKVRVKIVERTGDKLSDILHKSDAWGNEPQRVFFKFLMIRLK